MTRSQVLVGTEVKTGKVLDQVQRRIDEVVTQLRSKSAPRNLSMLPRTRRIARTPARIHLAYEPMVNATRMRTPTRLTVWLRLVSDNFQ